MADRIIAPINYSVIANGKFVSGGSVVFGVANVKPDINNPATLKAIYTDANLLIEAQNPQPLDSNGVFDQTANGVLYGVDSDTYSVVVFDSNGAELSYMPIYDLSDANAAITAQQAAADATTAETGALSAQAAAEQSESNTLALYTDFVNRYFGSFSVDPTVDDEGNPPNEGSLYWNTVSNRFKVYDSGVWIFPEDLGLGTAAYKDAQTSPTDSTADRVMLVGAGGLLGSYTSTETDLDLYPVGTLGVTTPGTGMTNGPTGAIYRATVDTLGNASGFFVTQKLTDDTGAIFERSKRITTWEAWKPVYTGVNYQPEIFNGLGVVKKLKNNSGGSIANGATVSGSLLAHYFIDATGTMIEAGATGGSGTTWMNVSGSNVGNGNGVEFVRTL